MEPRMDPAVATTGLRLLVGIPLAYAAYTGARGWAVALFLLFWLLDIADGYVARATGSESEFGRDFDFFTDWAVCGALGAALFLGGHIPAQSLLLAMVPLLLLAIGVAYGKRKAHKHFAQPAWARINGAAGYLLFLCLIVGEGVALGAAWLLLAYLYFARVHELALVVRALRTHRRERDEEDLEDDGYGS